MPLVQAELRMSEVIWALSYGLDITEGQPPGHAVRSSLIGMRLADELGLGGAGAIRSLLRAAPQGRRLLVEYGENLLPLSQRRPAAEGRRQDGRVDEPVGELSLGDSQRCPPELAARSCRSARPAGFKQGTQKEVFETRCERGADIVSELGFPEARCRRRAGRRRAAPAASRRAPARHRQARDLEPDPRQARPADRGRADRDRAASCPHPRAARPGDGVPRARRRCERPS